MSSQHELPPAQALAAVRARIEQARAAAIRPAPFTTLVAVSKTHGIESIRPVLEAGHRVFGESRVQEAKAKWPEVRAEFPDIELHLVGPLQTNKVRDAVALFDVIQSLDRTKLADALAKELQRGGRSPTLFAQINTGEELQKAGVAPQDADAFLAHCRSLGLPVQGLMCIPPLDEPPALHFALLQRLARAHNLPLLSMGMSGDFETAIRFGATHVRIGSAIFGERA
jgi:hypothetical protein